MNKDKLEAFILIALNRDILSIIDIDQVIELLKNKSKLLLYLYNQCFTYAAVCYIIYIKYNSMMYKIILLFIRYYYPLFILLLIRHYELIL